MGYKEFFLEVQKQLRLRGENLTSISERYGVCRPNFSKALKGKWRGPKAEFLVNTVCKYLDLEAPEPSPPPKSEKEMSA